MKSFKDASVRIVPQTPRTPFTPNNIHRAKIPIPPHSPLTPLTPLTPLSTNCLAAASASMTSISFIDKHQLQNRVMSWFCERGVHQSDLDEVKVSLFGTNRTILQKSKVCQLNRNPAQGQSSLIGRRFLKKLAIKT